MSILLVYLALGAGAGVLAGLLGIGGGLVLVAALAWLLAGRYYEVPDRQFTGLATPARISLMVILGALAASLVLWLWSIAP